MTLKKHKKTRDQYEEREPKLSIPRAKKRIQKLTPRTVHEIVEPDER